MLELIALSPGWCFRGSYDRSREARLYLKLMRGQSASVRLVNCHLSILLRPLEWLFPIAVTSRGWICLGRKTKPSELAARLTLPAMADHACLRVPAGHRILR